MVSRVKTQTVGSSASKFVRGFPQTVGKTLSSPRHAALERARQVSLARSHEEKSAASSLAIQHRDKKELELTLARARQIALARSHEEKSVSASLAIQHRDKKELERTLKKAREASLARSREKKSQDAKKSAKNRLKNLKTKKRSPWMNQTLSILALAFLLIGFGTNHLYASYNHHSHSQVISTEAGSIDFGVFENIKIPVYQKIRFIDQERKTVELEDGSLFSVSKIDAIKGWEGEKKLVITQNHMTFSTFKYALVNLDLRLAVPVSLLREPTPSGQVSFIKTLDTTHDKLTLNNNKSWLIHRSDRGILNKITENDRVILGANTGDDRENNPYLLIDTSKNLPVRAQSVE